ncbi:hypothetical protein IAT40_006704 [Kwoniella sp. CBS 6097]
MSETDATEAQYRQNLLKLYRASTEQGLADYAGHKYKQQTASTARSASTERSEQITEVDLDQITTVHASLHDEAGTDLWPEFYSRAQLYRQLGQTRSKLFRQGMENARRAYGEYLTTTSGLDDTSEVYRTKLAVFDAECKETYIVTTSGSLLNKDVRAMERELRSIYSNLRFEGMHKPLPDTDIYMGLSSYKKQPTQSTFLSDIRAFKNPSRCYERGSQRRRYCLNRIRRNRSGRC